MKIYNGRQKSKQVAVQLKGYSLVAVDSETGENIADLYDFKRMRAMDYAKGSLNDNGYDTSFADWGESGKMMGLLNPFEE